MATVATDSILGRATAGTGNVEVLTALPFAYTGDVTRAADSNVTSIATSAVTLAKQADVATSTVFYRKTAGTGAPEVNTLATLKTDLGLTGTNSGDQTITLTGDVTGSGTGSFATTIANNVVTNAKSAQMAANTIRGNNTGGTANVADLTVSQVNTMLGTATISGTPADNRVAVWNSASTIEGDANLTFTNTAATSQILAVLATGTDLSGVHVKPTSTGTAEVKVGNSRSGSGQSAIDLIGDTTYTTFGTRLIRENTGANASSKLQHRGTGTMFISTEDSATIAIYTNATSRMTISGNNGNVTLENNLIVKGQGYSELNTLTDAATIATDCDLGNIHTVTLGGNRTLGNPSNKKAGATYTWIIINDPTTPRTLAFNAVFKWAGGSAPTITQAVNAVDIITGVSDGTNIYCAINQNFA
jgi:hypothetical protein